MNERQQKIVELLGGDQKVSVRELATNFNVAEMTIRRDLTQLEKQGYLMRSHGGAVAAGRLRFLHSTFPHYTVSPEKEAIGRCAADLVTPGQTVMVDAGTTALEVAVHLPQNSDITVATTSLCVAQALYGSPVTVLLLGGFLRRDFPSLYGPVTENALKNIHVDTLFIGCNGADSVDGIYAYDLHVVNFLREIMRIADKVVLVTESDKFSKKAFARYGVWNEVNVVVTDSGLSAADRANVESQGVQVIIAEPPVSE